ncbi:MAG: hypothetical protein A2Y34_03955 [Spirochaetes bacterium GWC1_27_15]|nr:MAG: hypothetical protein A2Y34_03955 [Spirochaetes bacterium GWC1_27_15]
MILNEKELMSLKGLIFAESDIDASQECMECIKNPVQTCEYIDICNRYGSFWFHDGSEDMVRDLFDTIESLQK